MIKRFDGYLRIDLIQSHLLLMIKRLSDGYFEIEDKMTQVNNDALSVLTQILTERQSHSKNFLSFPRGAHSLIHKYLSI
jgi:hypothetical protein